MKKVAWILNSQIGGNRHYIAIDKAGKQVFETTVYDCGHGAAIAIEKLTAESYEITGAKWANDLIRVWHKNKQTW